MLRRERWIFPDPPVPAGETAASHLRALCRDGMVRRYGRETPEARQRLDHELAVIGRLGFAPYFVVVGEVMRHARARGISSVGRGSGAGALTAFLLGITNVDPLRYRLYFERFLHEKRPDHPDLDIDLCWVRRDEVIEHVYETYGHDGVAMLLNGIGHVVAKEALLDRRFIDARTDGIDDWLKAVEPCTPEWTEQITGVPADLIRAAARLYATSGASLCVHGLGVTEHRWGSHGVMALVDLALATGNLGKPGTGINPLRGQNNVQGASDVGCLPTFFTGYQALNDPALGSLHRAVTGRPLPTKRGMKTPDMWDAALAGRLWLIIFFLQNDMSLFIFTGLKSKIFAFIQD